MKRFLLLLLTILMLLPGCTQRSEESPEPSPSESPTVSAPVVTPVVSPSASPEATPEPIRHPLTGEVMDEELTVRPLAIMINNHTLAQPQGGVRAADIMYEILAEGGLTRMMAIVTDVESVERYGTIRSLRPYYLEVGLSYGAVIVHAGGSPQAYTDVTAKSAENLDGVRGANAGAYFYRDSSRIANGLEHSLFIKAEDLIKYANERGVELSSTEPYDFGLSFAEDGTPKNGESAKTVNLTFSSWKQSNFTYDADKAIYNMAQYGSDYKDGDTGDLMAFTNLLILEAPTKTVDNYGRLEVNLVGEGNGYFCCGGKYVPITWYRDALGEQFYYKTSDGEALTLGVGKSYVGVVPTGDYTMVAE